MEYNSSLIQKISIAVIVASLLISGFILYKRAVSEKINNVGNQQVQSGKKTVDIGQVKIEGEPFIGDKNAPVLIAYWFDYQCPFCKKFEIESMPQLLKDYIETGRVKLVFKDFQFLGPDSTTAGIAQNAVWETAPDKFYQWYESMFEKQDAENSGWGNKEDILALTESLGIDSKKINQLMEEKYDEYKKMMDDDSSEGRSFGVTGTPSFIIGDKLLIGAQPYSEIKQLIDFAGS